MDGVHDLGGRQGFGAVDVAEPEEPFHAQWEGRMWGIARGMRKPDGWTIDWFRHCRERIEPVDYLSRPYFDQWMQTYAAQLVDAGAVTVAELAAGKASGPGPGGAPPPESVAAGLGTTTRFDREPVAPPAFAVGERVRCLAHEPVAHGAVGHTRLPAYVRGCAGRIHACHGAHVLPDASAAGEERAEPLYSVVFEVAELWPESAGSADRVYLDLWESYLRSAATEGPSR